MVVPVASVWGTAVVERIVVHPPQKKVPLEYLFVVVETLAHQNRVPAQWVPGRSLRGVPCVTRVTRSRLVDPPESLHGDENSQKNGKFR